MNTRPTFTVFTATVNRAQTLPDTYQCLRAQTTRGFEWLIVDDGSTDATPDLVARWTAEADFPIRYVWQENQGKAAAVNRGVREARGELFLILDSDDTCVPDALARLSEIWHGIPVADRDGFSGVTVHCVGPDGGIVGDLFPASPLDDYPHRVAARVRGEKWGFHRTAVLRAHPYPEFPGERWVPEALVWNRIGQRYRVRHVNVALRRYTPAHDGIMASVRRLRMQNPNAAAAYYNERVALEAPWTQRLGAAINHVRSAAHAGRRVTTIVRASARPWLTAVALVPGLVLAGLDRGLERRDRAAPRIETRNGDAKRDAVSNG